MFFYSIAKKIAKNLKSENVPVEAVYFTLLTWWSFIASYKKVYAIEKKNENGILATMYSLILAPSGFGKNYVMKEVLTNCFEKCIDFISKEFESKYQKKKNELMSQADQKSIKLEASDNPNTQDKTYIDFKSRDRFLEQNEPTAIYPILKSSTPQAYDNYRAELSEDYMQNLGGLIFIHTEFEEFIKSQSHNKSDFVTYLGDIWDGREFGKSITKGEKHSLRMAKNIPNSMLVYTTHDPQSKILSALFKQSLARRSFVYFIENHESIEKKTKDEFKEELRENYTTGYEPLDFNDLFFEKLKELIKSERIIEFKMDFSNVKNNAFEKFLDFRADIKHKQTFMEPNSIEYLEAHNRHFKVFKLACIIQAFLDHTQEYISEEAMDEAMFAGNITEKYFKFFDKTTQSNPIQKMAEYFKENINKPVSKMDMRKTKIFHSDFVKQCKEFEEYMIEYALSLGCEFIEQKGGRNLKFYILKSLEKKLEGE